MMHLLHTRPAKHMLLMLFHISFIQCKGSDDFHERLSMVETIQNASLIGTLTSVSCGYTREYGNSSLYIASEQCKMCFLCGGEGG